MEIFRNTNFDFLGRKWPFIIVSLVLTAAGLVSLVMKGGPRYGIDFRGGALMDVKFSGPPPVDKIRQSLSSRISGEITVQNVEGAGAENEVLIGTELKDEKALNQARQAMVETLEQNFGTGRGNRLDFNNSGVDAIVDRLREPLQRAGAALSDQQLRDVVQAAVNYRNREKSGLLRNFDELARVPGVTPAVINTLKQECYLPGFAVKSIEVVGPKVGGELQRQAILATLYALAGMLVYIGFRFEWIYGVAAVLAVFHDTIVTVGLFSIFDKEITLTVIAALLTLVGYSMNDTIVIFDRIRENLKTMRREKLENVINLSVNQTLSRTIMTSGLTFLSVLALYLFGGSVLHGFSFALVVGIIIGSYSSVFIASPIVVFGQGVLERRKSRKMPVTPAPASTGKEAARRGPAKVVK